MTLGIRKPTQKDLALDLSNFSFPLTYLMLGQALVCLLLNNHENWYYLCHRTGSQGFNRQTCPLEGVEGETGHPDRTENNICLNVWGGPLPVTQGESGHSGRWSTHLSKGPWCTFASQCIMTCNTQRAEINKPIIWSVTATDTGVSLSLPLIISVKNVPLVQQKPGVIKYFASSFMKWLPRLTRSTQSLLPLMDCYDDDNFPNVWICACPFACLASKTRLKSWVFCTHTQCDWPWPEFTSRPLNLRSLVH